MIDTIIITLSHNAYHISDPERFMPSASWALHHTKKYHYGMQSKQNPSTKELVKGVYKPRLTLAYRRGITTGKELLLKIELSLPKLMYGNNFNELQYKDFNQVTEKLVAVLATMGVIVTAHALAQAPVMAIHYSKNIVLTDGSTPYHYIQKIKEANITQALDTNQTDYRNEGHSYRWHCNSYEVIFYDKIKDLEKAKLSKRRSLENDSALQMHLFDAFKNRKKLEFLRMEVRLNKRAKIKQLFKALDISADLTLQKLFKPAIAKKILLHYLDILEQNRSPLSNFKTMTDKQFLAKLAVNNPDISIKDALALFGFKKALETTTLRELKMMFGKNNQAAWNRFIKRSETIKLPSQHTSFDVLREQLETFKPVKLHIKTF